MSEIEIRKITGGPDPIIITGMTRSGKILLCNLISSLEKCDKVNVDFYWEQVPFLHHIGEINEEASKYLLQSGYNIKFYDNAIGRNANFRPDDYTSVWKYKEPQEYIKRLSLSDGDNVFDRYMSSGRIFSTMVHNGLWHSDIWFKSFPNLKMFHMKRSPLLMAYSWLKKGYGGQFYLNPRSQCLTYHFNNNVVPYYCYGWEDEYLDLEQGDRVVKMIEKIIQGHQHSFERLSKDNKERVHIISHEELAIDTEKVLGNVGSIIGARFSSKTPVIMKESDTPRKIDKEEYESKKKHLKENLSEYAYESLIRLEEEFLSGKIKV